MLPKKKQLCAKKSRHTDTHKYTYIYINLHMLTSAHTPVQITACLVCLLDAYKGSSLRP